MLVALSQLERDAAGLNKLRLQRQREGIEIAKAQGNVHCMNKFILAKAYPHRPDEVWSALWGMEVKKHHGQGLYSENGYVSKYFLPPCA